MKTPPKKVPSSEYSRNTPRRHDGGNWPLEPTQKRKAVQAEYDRLARRWAGPRLRCTAFRWRRDELRPSGEVPSRLEGFVDGHAGPDRQLTLRLAVA